MKRVYLLVEGQTEETFVRELIAPHCERFNVYATPIILTTSPGHRGGVASYGKVRNQVLRLCRQDRNALVSTMIDLYALPNDFPGKSTDAYPAQGSGRQKAQFIESRMTEDIPESNFLPHLMVHEFEALLFAEPRHFSGWVDSTDIVEQLEAIARRYTTPEDINDSIHTAPCKRIQKLMPAYEKTFHGPLIAQEIGLETLRRACPHFDVWLDRLEQLGVGTGA